MLPAPSSGKRGYPLFSTDIRLLFSETYRSPPYSLPFTSRNKTGRDNGLEVEILVLGSRLLLRHLLEEWLA